MGRARGGGGGIVAAAAGGWAAVIGPGGAGASGIRRARGSADVRGASAAGGTATGGASAWGAGVPVSVWAGAVACSGEGAGSNINGTRCCSGGTGSETRTSARTSPATIPCANIDVANAPIPRRRSPPARCVRPSRRSGGSAADDLSALIVACPIPIMPDQDTRLCLSPVLIFFSTPHSRLIVRPLRGRNAAAMLAMRQAFSLSSRTASFTTSTRIRAKIGKQAFAAFLRRMNASYGERIEDLAVLTEPSAARAVPCSTDWIAQVS